LTGLFEQEKLGVDDVLVLLIFSVETVSISIDFGAGNERAAGF